MAQDPCGLGRSKVVSWVVVVERWRLAGWVAASGWHGAAPDRASLADGGDGLQRRAARALGGHPSDRPSSMAFAAVMACR
jgi:hypothetical protein